MEQLFKKHPKMPLNNRAMFASDVYRLPPIEGKIIDPGGKKTKRKHAMGPKMPLGIRPVTHGSDLRDLLHSTHTKDTVDRIKVGSNFNHAANLFDHAHHAGGMGAVRAAYHGGHGMLK